MNQVSKMRKVSFYNYAKLENFHDLIWSNTRKKLYQGRRQRHLAISWKKIEKQEESVTVQ